MFTEFTSDSEDSMGHFFIRKEKIIYFGIWEQEGKHLLKIHFEHLSVPLAFVFDTHEKRQRVIDALTPPSIH